MKKELLEENDSKNMKGISKAVYIISCIFKVLSIVGIVVGATALISSAVLLSNINVNNNTIKVFNKELKYEIGGTIKIDGEVVADDLDVNSINQVTDFLNKTNTYKVGYTSLLFISLIITMVCSYKLFGYLEKLFRNIYNQDTPFTLDNVNYSYKIGLYFALVILVPDLLNLLIELIFNLDINISTSLFSYLYILIIWVIYYIFKYGYNLQNKQ